MTFSRQNVARVLLLTALGAVAMGCGASENTTKVEEDAFKSHDASTLKMPPPGAGKPPAGFKSSIGGLNPGGGAPTGN